MFTVGLVVLGVAAIGACGHVATQPSAPQSAAPAGSSPIATPTATTTATGSACADASSVPDAAPTSVQDAEAVSAASGTAQDDAILPLPAEPWYHDRPDREDDCVPPLATPARRHFPAPFGSCDPRSTSFASPPTGSELHFYYRFFSVVLTAERRAQNPGVCCYMVWSFPRRR